MRTTNQTKPFHHRMASAAAYLADAVGGDVDYVKLLKLIYLADREALDKYGHPITYDDYLALQMGPVTDDTYQVLEHREEMAEYWKDAIKIVGEKGLRVVLPRIPKEAAAQPFSEAEREILDKMVSRHGRKSRARLISETHRLREWQQVRNVQHRKKIAYEDILMALGRSKERAIEMAREIRAYRSMMAVPEGSVPEGGVRDKYEPGGFALDD
jgi:uncharacterized phage-associated protein